ncbi:MAG TPA: hypothetical protein VFS37_07220 [Conexibacter sp.]|nr:hypothetical protein [Conexibacter sp.]
MRQLRPLLASVAAVAAVACLAPASASAITLGSTDRPTALAAMPCDQPSFRDLGYLFYQPVTLFGLPSSQAPTGGTIASWRSDQFGSGDPGATLALVIVRPTRDGVQVVGADVQTLPPTIPREDVVFTPSRPLMIAAGDFIGIWGPDDRAGCAFSGGRSSEAFAYAEVGPTLTVGSAFPVRQQSFNRVNVAAELSPGVGGPTPPTPTPPSTPPGPPTIGPDGRPTVSRDGQVSAGQNVGCSTAGPCRVVTTAVVYYTTGQVIAAAAARGRRARRRTLVVGRRTFAIPAGGSAAVTFPLNRAGRRALARLGRLRLTVTTTVAQAGARAVVARRTFTIRAPRRAARRRARR